MLENYVKNIISLINPNIIQVYIAVIEGMLKTRKSINNSTNITIPNGAAVQAAIKAKKN